MVLPSGLCGTPPPGRARTPGELGFVSGALSVRLRNLTCVARIPPPHPFAGRKGLNSRPPHPAVPGLPAVGPLTPRGTAWRMGTAPSLALQISQFPRAGRVPGPCLSRQGASAGGQQPRASGVTFYKSNWAGPERAEAPGVSERKASVGGSRITPVNFKDAVPQLRARILGCPSGLLWGKRPYSLLGRRLQFGTLTKII